MRRNGVVMASHTEPTTEKAANTQSGIVMLLFLAILVLAEVFGIAALRQLFAIPAVLIGCLILFTLRGFFALQPNNVAVVTLFGAYLGSERQPGLHWILPWKARRNVSVRVRNHNIETLK